MVSFTPGNRRGVGQYVRVVIVVVAASSARCMLSRRSRPAIRWSTWSGRTRPAARRSATSAWSGFPGRANGAELDLALRARELWQDVGDLIPATGFRPQRVADPRPQRRRGSRPGRGRRASRRDPTGLAPTQRGGRHGRNPALRGRFTAALHCDQDAAVEPAPRRPGHSRLSVHTGLLPLAARPRGGGVGDHHVTDDHGDTHRGDLVVLAPAPGIGACYPGTCARAAPALRESGCR